MLEVGVVTVQHTIGTLAHKAGYADCAAYLEKVQGKFRQMIELGDAGGQAGQFSQDTPPSSQHTKSKTAKQLSSVVRQFGSIGKTVSKRIKKNFGSITRLARTGSFRGGRGQQVSQTTRLESCRIVSGHKDHILASMIHTQKCLPYRQVQILVCMFVSDVCLLGDD